ncbi:hypothetical protein LX36DRAFT_109643 [Colletotrichum falcatum]|nr:hypothetical protein LX36DRAFT_109643 [Colletotrichum falcatum]
MSLQWLLVFGCSRTRSSITASVLFFPQPNASERHGGVIGGGTLPNPAAVHKMLIIDKDQGPGRQHSEKETDLLLFTTMTSCNASLCPPRLSYYPRLVIVRRTAVNSRL